MQDKLWLSTISVGRELVLMPYGNFARTAGGRTPITRTVTKVGKKYFYIGNDAFSRKTGEYIDRNECNGGYVLYPDMAAYEEAVRTADERSAIKKIVDADFYGYDPFSCWRTYTVSDAAVHEIYRILVECGAIKTSTEEGKPDGKSCRIVFLRRRHDTLVCPSPHGTEHTMPSHRDVTMAIHQPSRSGALARTAATPNSKAAQTTTPWVV